MLAMHFTHHYCVTNVSALLVVHYYTRQQAPIIDVSLWRFCSIIILVIVSQRMLARSASAMSCLVQAAYILAHYFSL